MNYMECLFFKGTIKAGGSSYVLQVASETGRMNMFELVLAC